MMARPKKPRANRRPQASAVTPLTAAIVARSPFDTFEPTGRQVKARALMLELAVEPTRRTIASLLWETRQRPAEGPQPLLHAEFLSWEQDEAFIRWWFDAFPEAPPAPRVDLQRAAGVWMQNVLKGVEKADPACMDVFQSYQDRSTTQNLGGTRERIQIAVAIGQQSGWMRFLDTDAEDATAGE